MAVAAAASTHEGMQHDASYGASFGVQSRLRMLFGFTGEQGEQTDTNELVYLRARYRNPGMERLQALIRLRARPNVR